MTLKAVLDSLDGLEDQSVPMKDIYTESDGKFVLAVESVGGFALEDVQGLKTALGKERKDREALTKKLETYGDLDVDAAQEALRKLDEMKTWTPDEKVKEQIAAKEKALLEKHAKEIGDRDTKLGLITKQLEKNLIEAAATAALTKHKGDVTLLLPHVMSQTRMDQSDGKFIARVVDADGTARISMKQGSTDPMDIEELVGLMRDDETFARGFEGTGHSGGGAQGQAGGSGNKGTHRLSQADASDPRKYAAAKERAHEAGVKLIVETPHGALEV